MKTSEFLTRFENVKLYSPAERETFYEKAQQSYSKKVWSEWDSVFGRSENRMSDFFLENVTTFSEVRTYNGKCLVDMDETERAATVESIFEQLEKFDVTPIAYEVKKDSVLLCWYVLPVLRPFNDYGILLPDYLDNFKMDDSKRGEV